jgi:DNA-directed RNA polymerase specialized sigma24 family protein
MKEIKLSKEQQQIILELYKAHYSAKEVANVVDIPYQKVAAIFRGFKVAQIKKYDRLTLIKDGDITTSLV